MEKKWRGKRRDGAHNLPIISNIGVVWSKNFLEIGVSREPQEGMAIDR